MFRAIPSSNKHLTKMWNDKNLTLHQTNVRNARSRVDLSSPNKFSHLKFKAKNLALQEERYSEIERENKILLGKMTQISNTNSLKQLPRLSKSLNKEARKRKLVQITVENQAIIKRLSQKKSSYNIDRWENQRKKVEKLLDNICEYPYTLGSSQKLFRSTAKSSKSSGKFIETPKTSQTQFRRLSKSVLLKKKQIISGLKFLVEVKRSKIGYKVSAFKKDSHESYSFQIGNEEALEIMGGKEDFAKLISALKMDGEDMILVEYRE